MVIYSSIVMFLYFAYHDRIEIFFEKNLLVLKMTEQSYLFFWRKENERIILNKINNLLSSR